MRHETVCELYRLAEAGRRWEASEGLPLTPADEIINHLKRRLFGIGEQEDEQPADVRSLVSNLPRRRMPGGEA